ncbi:MAG TPA: hypothetical protein VJB14_02905 [Planctomycetota bacterium]|nr:hypothetical protein [Planctomycetota bacterium]
MRWVWKVTTDAPHTVVAEISLVTSRETLWVDGKVVSDQKSMKFRNEHPVPLGAGHEGKAIVSTAWYGVPRCRLEVDGRERPASKGEKGRVEMPAEAPAQAKMPGWAWVFIVLCAAIPVITLGGAIPGAIGGGAAAGCAGVSRIQTLSTAARVGICIGITVAAWVAFVVIVGSLVAARRR